MLEQEEKIMSRRFNDTRQSFDSQDFERVNGSKIYLKGITKDKFLEIASKGPKKLGPDYNYYFRSSPKRAERGKRTPIRRKRERTRPKKVREILKI